MLTQIETRTGQIPEEFLADCGYVDHDDRAATAEYRENVSRS